MPANALVAACRHLWQRGILGGFGGNLSVRQGDVIWITPAGRGKACLKATDIVRYPGTGRPSSELPLHRALYRCGDEIGAVVHTHSPCATAFACRGKTIPALTPESKQITGRIGLVPACQPGSDQLAEAVVECVASVQGVLLLQDHGVLTWAADLERAVLMAELVEEAALTAFYYHLLGEME
ncbi:MAG TPA: class II aldolase/adducin family protein [Firmicutes bacterium]|nr:class II aldolase/adducin family protein [Bacillota bacterium]